MTIHVNCCPSVVLSIYRVEVVGVGVVGVGSVWIHLLFQLHIYTLPVTDKVMFNMVCE